MMEDFIQSLNFSATTDGKVTLKFTDGLGFQNQRKIGRESRCALTAKEIFAKTYAAPINQPFLASKSSVDDSIHSI